MLAIKDIGADTPFVMDVGELKTEIDLLSREKSLSMRSMFTTKIPSDMLKWLLEYYNVNTSVEDSPDITLESNSIFNEARHLSDVYWTTGNFIDAEAAATCGPFLVFSKEWAEPLVTYFTTQDVQTGKGLLTFWGRDTWRSMRRDNHFLPRLLHSPLRCPGETIDEPFEDS